MDDFLREVTSDFALVGTSSGFRFNQYSGPVDWEKLDAIVVSDIVNDVDVENLSTLVASVLSYNVEKMSASKKMFRLSQLIIDFLLHYKKHSIFKFDNKKGSTEFCELCGKITVDVNFLRYHCFRQHTFNSCDLKDERRASLKSEAIQHQTKSNNIKSSFRNKLKISKPQPDEQHINNCYTVHKKKLSYQLIPQPGDNPMQTQEMFWKQKYDNLEENYNTLKHKYEKIQNASKNTTAVNHKYQNSDSCKTEKFSTFVQTDQIENTTVACSPKRPPRKIDGEQSNENIAICSIDIPDTNETNSEFRRGNGDVNFDRDFYELKKLRLEARMNINDNICEDNSESLSCSDYVDSIRIVLILGQSRVNELFKNATLMELIKFDVKEIVNKRLEEYYSFIDENIEQDKILLEKSSYKNQEICQASICEDDKTEQHSLPKIDSDKISVKKNKTVMSKLKKKALRFSKIFSPGQFKDKQSDLETE